MAEEFAPYAGKDIDFFVDKDMLDMNPSNLNDGSIDVTIDMEDVAKLMKHTSIYAFGATEEVIEFYIEGQTNYHFLYFYDENASEETSEVVNEWCMVNIAPHWWWYYTGAED